MRTKEDVERYLIDLGAQYDVLGDGIYSISGEDDEHIDGIVICVSGPLVVFSIRLMKVPTKNLETFFRELLELNASDLVAGAYGIEDDYVVITDTLQLENLDFNEFQASVESLEAALEKHYPVLAKYRD